MKLTKAQERVLIDWAINKMIEQAHGPSVVRQPWNKGKTGMKWSVARRAKFKQTMKKKWAKKAE